MAILLSKLTYLIKDFWYPTIQYSLAFTYLLLLFFFIQKTKLKKLTKIIIANFLIFLLIIATSWISLEIYFRYIYDQSDTFGVMLTSQRWMKRHIEDKEQLRGEEKFRDLKDYRQPKKAGTSRIAVVGDSITFGQGIESIEDRFSNLLETLLQNQSSSVEVFNFSRPGADFNQHQHYIDLITNEHNFDLIIWQVFPNDIGGPPSPHVAKYKQQVLTRQQNPLFKNLINNSFVFNYYYYRLSALQLDDRQAHLDYQISLFQDQTLMAETQAKINLIITQLKANHLPVIVVLFPYINLLDDQYPTFIHKKLAQIFESHQIPVIDLLEDFTAYSSIELSANKFDPHPNQLANKLTVQKLFELLSSNQYNYLFK